MRPHLLSALLAFVLATGAGAQTISWKTAKFNTGDSMEWTSPDFDDSSWQTLRTGCMWTEQGIPDTVRFAWYRFHLRPTKAMLKDSDLKQYLDFELGLIDDADEVYLNGKLIGRTGRIPSATQGYSSDCSTRRVYRVNTDDKAIRWNDDNVLAVRCFNGGGPGGMFSGDVQMRVPDLIEMVAVDFSDTGSESTPLFTVSVSSTVPRSVSGMLTVDVVDMETGNKVETITRKVSFSDKKPARVMLPYEKDHSTRVHATFTERKSGKNITASYSPKYVLTPAAPATPRFNTATVYGARPGSPIHFRFGVSGERPMTITSADLPAGLHINPDNGALSGSLDKPGDYAFTVTAKNAKGEAHQKFTVKIGNVIALTPPMGWNSWNCWGLSVTQDKVISSAQALIDKGLADYGYAYMNIDDGWEAPERNADGTIAVNEKFPDMKALGDWLHGEGLKFGIYSSPGFITCGGYIGSIDHEKQDAESYNSWGIDYLKYDWCGYYKAFDEAADKGTLASYVRPYLEMEEYLREQPRDIFYSLCQYGMADVWKWGRYVDANSWRTTGDIEDSWRSLYEIGFNRQAELHPYAGPGGWNDPDMLVVGKVGWSNNLRDSRLTAEEQYSHISLWALLASNMLIGCDLAQLDDFTIGLLCNNEVNAVNQDVLGKQAKRDVLDGDIQIWSRPLADGSRAIGIFNVGDKDAKVDIAAYKDALGLKNIASIRDLWRQKNLSADDTAYLIASHGVRFIKVTE